MEVGRARAHRSHLHYRGEFGGVSCLSQPHDGAGRYADDCAVHCAVFLVRVVSHWAHDYFSGRGVFYRFCRVFAYSGAPVSARVERLDWLSVEHDCADYDRRVSLPQGAPQLDPFHAGGDCGGGIVVLPGD